MDSGSEGGPAVIRARLTASRFAEHPWGAARPALGTHHRPEIAAAGRVGRRSPQPFDKLRAGSAEGAPSSCQAARFRDRDVDHRMRVLPSLKPRGTKEPMPKMKRLSKPAKAGRSQATTVSPRRSHARAAARRPNARLAIGPPRARLMWRLAGSSGSSRGEREGARPHQRGTPVMGTPVPFAATEWPKWWTNKTTQ